MAIPLVFIFLSCREEADDNKELSCENSKPCRVYIYIYIILNIVVHET